MEKPKGYFEGGGRLPVDNWGTPLRDTLSEADIRLELGEINPKLAGFLASDGVRYQRPYEEISSRIGEQITENRLETWKKFFQDLGLLWVDDGTLHLTRFGHVVANAYADARRETEQERLKIAAAAVRVLGRQQLLNPTTLNRGYPADCDVLPYRAIWSAINRLGSLHWEELHRVMLRVMKQDQLEGAIERIEQAREKPGYDPSDPNNATENLGEPVYPDADQATRRNTPWFSAAGFGGLLIDREPINGRRSFTPLGALLIPAELAEPRSWEEFGNDQAAWFGYLSEAIDAASEALDEEELIASHLDDEDEVYLEVQKLLTVDQAPGVLFVGPPGTGKSWYARQIAVKLTNGRASRVREVQFHPSYQYEDFVEGYVPDPEKGFKLADRHLLEMIALADKVDGPVVLVIDEFSRTDPSRVLGETMTYMESSLRGVQFYLPSGRRISIPANLVFLATMNPEDRSVDELDSAMDRRWAKVNLAPDQKTVRKFLTENSAPARLIGAAIDLFVALQDHIEVGHAFFRTVKDKPSLERLWESQILPLAKKRFRFDQGALREVEALWAECLGKIDLAVAQSAESDEPQNPPANEET